MINKKQISIVLIIFLVLNLILLALKKISPLFFWINIGVIFAFSKFYLNKKQK